MRGQDRDEGLRRPGGYGHERRSGREWDRFWPRSILGITALVLAASLGAALSGTILFAYYQYELTSITNRVNTYVADVNQRYRAALPTAAHRPTSITTDPTTVLKRAYSALWYLHTIDASGQPSVGTAFAVASSSSQTLLVASYTTIAAATHQPGPAVYASQGPQGGQGVAVHLQSWQAGQDLALLVLPEGGQPTLTLSQSPPAVGKPVFALSAAGSQGSVSAGQVTAVSSQFIQDTAVLGSDDFQGGPLVDGSGQVVGMDSRTYEPLGGSPAAVPVPVVCQQVLQCPGSVPSG